MHTLKDLVDNFVQNLIQGTDQFDVQRLQQLHGLFATITKDQMKSFKLSALQQRQNEAKRNHPTKSPNDTLYQSLLWCLIFQASIDMLSNSSSICSSSNLLERAWEYVENLRKLFHPFIKHNAGGADYGKKSRIANVNLNQSNSTGGERSGDRVHRQPHIPEPVSSDESLVITSPIIPANRKSRSFGQNRHGVHEIGDTSPPRNTKSSKLPSTPYVQMSHSGSVSSRDAWVSTDSPLQIPSERCFIESNRVSVEVQTLPEMVDRSTQFSPSPSEETPSRIPQQPQLLDILNQYKTAKRQLATEATKYLAMFKQCHNLQNKLRLFQKSVSQQAPDYQQSTPVYTKKCAKRLVAEKDCAHHRMQKHSPVERYLLTAAENVGPFPPVTQCLPKVVYESSSLQAAKVHSEVVCMTTIEMPLLSLVDLQCFVDQAGETYTKKLTTKDRIVRAFPYKCRGLLKTK
ncbi:unnamed protein product [Mesocestoides corti]|nr:unnamed protein product [Mesocestoides corti]